MSGQGSGLRQWVSMFGQRTVGRGGRIRAVVVLGGCVLAAMGAPKHSFAGPCSTPTITLSIPAAVMSPSPTRSSGLFSVRWGDCWYKGDLDITNPISQKYWYAMKDPWFHGRTESMVIGVDSWGDVWYADGLSMYGFSATPLPSEHPNFFQPFKTLAPQNVIKLSGYTNTFWQHQSLPWPQLDYETMKSLALRRWYPYYQTTPDGRLFDPRNPGSEPFQFEQLYDVGYSLDPDDIDHDDFPPFVFIDTVDAAPPKSDGSNLATIRLMRSGVFFYGSFFLAANVEFVGSGNSPTYDFPVRPDDTVTTTAIRNCRLMGLMYSYGEMEFQGSGSVYGALCAERGIKGGGSWAVFYDARLGDPNRNNLFCTVSFEHGSAAAAEGEGVVSIPVVLECDYETTTTIDYNVTGGTATPGADYEITTGTLVFFPGQTTQYIQTRAVDDSIPESRETLVLNLSNTSCASIGRYPTCNVSIHDNDTSVGVEFFSSGSSVYERSEKVFAYVFCGRYHSPVEATVRVTGGTAVEGRDFSLTTDTARFEPGDTEGGIWINVFDNYEVNPDRTIQLSLVSAVNAFIGSPSSVVLTILDDDALKIIRAFPLSWDYGWSREGGWEFGTPQGAGGFEGVGADPTAAFSGQYVYGYNLSGNYPPNLSDAQSLTLGPLYCSWLNSTRLVFRRWLAIQGNANDHAAIQISLNGTDWDTVWSNPAETLIDSQWTQVDYDISSWADYQDIVYIRWTLGPTDGSIEYGGWNIDDIEIWAVSDPDHIKTRSMFIAQ